MREYDKLIKSGNIAQLEKLQKNDHKRGFEDVDIYYAFDRIVDELKELRAELFTYVETGYQVKFTKRKEQYDLIKTRLEAADIANFAHMIIHKCDQELKRSF